MKLILIIACLVLIAAITATFVWFVHTSKSTSIQQQQTTQIKNEQIQPLAFRNRDLITKPDGWLIPDISKLKTSSRRGKLLVKQYSTDVYATSYDTQNLLLPRKNFDGTDDPISKIQVKSLTVFDIDKRPFCYQMLIWNVPPEGESGVGVVVYHTFYDLDGDGKFETWAITGGSMKSLIMPQWIKP